MSKKLTQNRKSEHALEATRISATDSRQVVFHTSTVICGAVRSLSFHTRGLQTVGLVMSNATAVQLVHAFQARSVKSSTLWLEEWHFNCLHRVRHDILAAVDCYEKVPWKKEETFYSLKACFVDLQPDEGRLNIHAFEVDHHGTWSDRPLQRRGTTGREEEYFIQEDFFIHGGGGKARVMSLSEH